MDNETNELINNEIKTNEVCLFMKGTPESPMCGFSASAVQMLEACDVEDVATVNVLENQDIREGIKEFSNWPTIPQLYVKNEFIGGCDIVKEMYESGELAKLLEDNGIEFKKKS